MNVCAPPPENFLVLSNACTTCLKGCALQSCSIIFYFVALQLIPFPNLIVFANLQRCCPWLPQNLTRANHLCGVNMRARSCQGHAEVHSIHTSPTTGLEGLRRISNSGIEKRVRLPVWSPCLLPRHLLGVACIIVLTHIRTYKCLDGLRVWGVRLRHAANNFVHSSSSSGGAPSHLGCTARTALYS